MKSLSRVRPSATPWTAAYQAPLSMGFSRQEYWSGVPLPSDIASNFKGSLQVLKQAEWPAWLPNVSQRGVYLGDEQTQVTARGQDLRAKEEFPKDEKQLVSKPAWRVVGKGATFPVCPSGGRSAELPNHSLLRYFLTHNPGSLLRLDEAVMLCHDHQWPMGCESRSVVSDSLWPHGL